MTTQRWNPCGGQRSSLSFGLAVLVIAYFAQRATSERHSPPERAQIASASAPPIHFSSADKAPCLIDSIFAWNGRVTVAVRKGLSDQAPASRYWVHDADRRCFVPHPLGRELRLLAHTGPRALAVIETTAGRSLVEYRGNAAPEMLRHVEISAEVVLTSNRERAFIVAPDGVQAIGRDGTARSTIQESGVTTAIATADELIVSCDMGEFGATVNAYQVDRGGRVGRKRELAAKHVSFAMIAGDEVWLGGNLAHMGLYEATLLRYTRRRALHDVIDGLIRNGTTIQRVNGLTADEDGKILILEPNSGLFEIISGMRAVPIWAGRTAVECDDVLSVGGMQVSVTVRDSPQGMVAAGGRLFVASRSLGVYEFERVGSRYNFVRILPFR